MVPKKELPEPEHHAPALTQLLICLLARSSVSQATPTPDIADGNKSQSGEPREIDIKKP